MPTPQSKIRACLLLAAGAGLLLAYRRIYGGSEANTIPPALTAQLLLLPLLLGLSFIAPLQRGLTLVIDRLRAPRDRGRLITAGVLALLATFYLWGSAVLHWRDLTPRMQDEFSYLIQAQLLSRGKLWVASPPLADFFETFHLLVKPVYASVYFPGTALLYVPGVWFGWSHVATSLLISGAAVGLLYLLVAEVLDGAFGVLAAVLLLTTTQFRWTSTLALSNIPAMLAGMILALAWLRWHRSRGRGWAIVAGLSAGWGLIVRPLDMIAWLVPIGAMILFDLAREPRARRWSVLLMLAAAVPFVGLQLAFNKGVTGNVWRTPYQYYFDEFQPNTSLGFADDDPTARPNTTLPQKLDLYEDFLRPLIRKSRVEMLGQWRLPFLVSATMPSDVLLLLLPVGLAAAIGNRRWLFAAVPVLFLGLYLLYPYFMPYYPLSIAPAIIVVLLCGLKSVLFDFCTSRSSGGVVFGMLAVFALGVAALPEVRLDFAAERDGIPGLGEINTRLPEMLVPPAVVLFAYTEGTSCHTEPVYNAGVADPLEASIIRAHDLGIERNRELISYFARTKPQATFYRYDRGIEQLRRLGTAAELEARGFGHMQAAQ